MRTRPVPPVAPKTRTFTTALGKRAAGPNSHARDGEPARYVAPRLKTRNDEIGTRKGVVLEHITINLHRTIRRIYGEGACCLAGLPDRRRINGGRGGFSPRPPAPPPGPAPPSTPIHSPGAPGPTPTRR